MASDSLWQRWRRRLLAFFFIAQYHFHMSLLNLRFHAHTISRMDIEARSRDNWSHICKALASHAALKSAKHTLEHGQATEALRLTRQKLESERFQTALHRAKTRLEKIVFTEEDASDTAKTVDISDLKTVWHGLETQKIPQVTSNKLKATWRSFEIGTLPRVAPDKLKAARHPWKALKALRHPKITLFTLGGLSLLLIVLFALNNIAGQSLAGISGFGISTVPQIFISSLNPMAHQATNINASKALARISQLDLNEYASQSEYDTWAYSACSAASMTEVLNSYGHHYHITDILKVESAIGEITPQLGLLENIGVANTAAKFGFQTTWGNSWSLDQVKSYANTGKPVIVGWPPARYSGGHIVVVTGGDSDMVYLADSSLYNRRAISNAQFLQWWGGFAAVVTPI
ncbi:MAG TPA: C39 family peptidase [Ktedonobacteraceae bacterium]